MSMNCSILGLTPAQIDGLVATPALATDVVLVAWDETRKAQLEASRATDNRDRVAKERQVRIAEGRERIARLGSFELPLNLEKWWHSVHYLLTGEIGPVGGARGLLLTAGRELGEDMGYGRARLHSPTEAKEFSRFLETQDLANLQARMSLEDMGHLYPRRLSEDDLDNLRDNVGCEFVRLQDYVHKICDRGNGLLIWVI